MVQLRESLDIEALPSSLTNMTDKAAILLDENQKRIIEALKRSDGVLCCIKAHPTSGKGFRLEFLSKGAANVVFRCRPYLSDSRNTSMILHIVQITHSGSRARPVNTEAVRDMVIRVPRGMPKCLSGVEIMDGFSNHIAPLFPSILSEHLMDHQLIALFPDVVESLTQKDENGLIQASKAAQQSRWAILLPDMSSIPGSSITVEVKPKWLAQSPDAPKAATRCRTCAMQILCPKNRDTYVCPLRLVEGKRDDLYSMVHNLVQTTCRDPSTGFAPIYGVSVARIAEAVTTYLVNGDGRILLQHLRRLQSSLDPHGVLKRPQQSDTFDHDLRLAMTLRDCSLFLNVSYNRPADPGGINVMSKLADLDFKSAEKILDWAEKESNLKEGAYTKMVKDDVECWLMRRK